MWCSPRTWWCASPPERGAGGRCLVAGVRPRPSRAAPGFIPAYPCAAERRHPRAAPGHRRPCDCRMAASPPCFRTRTATGLRRPVLRYPTVGVAPGAHRRRKRRVHRGPGWCRPAAVGHAGLRIEGRVNAPLRPGFAWPLHSAVSSCYFPHLLGALPRSTPLNQPGVVHHRRQVATVSGPFAPGRALPGTAPPRTHRTRTACEPRSNRAAARHGPRRGSDVSQHGGTPHKRSWLL